MCDSELKKMLTSTEMEVRPDPAHVHAVRERMLHIASRAGSRSHPYRNALLVTVVAIGVSGVGLAATERGRNLIRWVFTPVEPAHSARWEAPDGSIWTQSTTGREEPYHPDEADAVAQEFAEIYASQQAGEGRLVGLIESPGSMGVNLTVFEVEYTRDNGEKTSIGSSIPTGKQAENMRIDEIMRLRNAGEGEILSQESFPIGMGNYLIRFTLADGATVDLKTQYPPSTLEERERIFAEMRELKAGLRFTVLNAHYDASNPEGGVWGLLQYQLQDGRTVGAAEQLPPEVISEDGTEILMPDLDVGIAIEAAAAEPE